MKIINILLFIAAGDTIPAHAMLTASRLNIALAIGKRAMSQPSQALPLITLNQDPRPEKFFIDRLLNSKHRSLDEQHKKQSDDDTFQHQRARVSATFLAGGTAAALGLGYKITTHIEPEVEQQPEITDRLVENTCSDITTFLIRFAPPERITHLIERYEQEILLQITHNRYNYYEGSSICEEAPSVIVESDISSLINAERLQECIRRNNLDELGVSKKYAYKLSSQLIVTSEALKNTVCRKYTLKEIQQLVTLAEQTSYGDWSKHNVVINGSNNMITLIGTDDRSFHNQPSPQAALESLFYFLNIEELMHSDAREWLQSRLNTINDQLDPKLSCAEFDPPKIDFESIRAEYEQDSPTQQILSPEIVYTAIGIGTLYALIALIVAFGNQG